MRIVHLDHTSVVGGAEFALLRMLRAHPSWSPVLLVAPATGRGLGIYDGVPPEIPLKVVGRSTAGRREHRSAAAPRSASGSAWPRRRSRCGAPGRSGSADLVDANTARAAAYGALAVRWPHKPFVVHLRDLVEPDALGPAGHSLMVRLVLPRADGVIANSHATLASALEHLRPGVPAEVIPSASGLRRGGTTGLPAGDGPVRTVGMLARIDPWKGQHVLLEAFARVFGGRDVRLQLAGEALFGHEDHLDELQRRAAELGVADQVDFLGHVNDVDALIAHWDLAVQASTRPEPLGQNVLQYLAAGRAVIAVDEGGPAEWITDGVNGLLVPPRDPATLAAALSRLDSDAALRSRLAAAAAATPGLLDDEAVTHAHEAFYERVLRFVADRHGKARNGCDGAEPEQPTAQPGSPCGGSAATTGWSKLSAPTFAAPPGEPTSSKNSTLAVVVGPDVGQVVLVVDRLDRADRLAGAAVDAFVGVDVERALTLVDAVDGALVDAGAVLDVDARQRDDVGHDPTRAPAREISTCSSRGTTFTRSRTMSACAASVGSHASPSPRSCASSSSHPAQVVKRMPRASSSSNTSSPSGPAETTGAGSAPAAASASRFVMVSRASPLVWPMRPTGPRLIQPVA